MDSLPLERNAGRETVIFMPTVFVLIDSQPNIDINFYFLKCFIVILLLC